MNELMNIFGQNDWHAELRSDPYLDRQPGADPVVVVRRDQEARDDQLPDLQAGARRPVLRPDLSGRSRTTSACAASTSG